MRQFYESLIEPLLDRLRAKRIVEIGVAEGAHSALLAGWCQRNDARLHMIDTAPRFNVDDFLARFGGVAQIHVGTSLNVLPELPAADLVCIDGDHNWYTVYHELQACFAHGRMPVCLFHDTGWPYARRDLYYDPETIPAQYRHEWKRGPIQQNVSDVAEIGLNPTLCHARHEGGSRNGVLCAIEDFIAEHPGEFHLVTLPVLFGFSILAPLKTLQRHPALAIFLKSLDLPGHVRSLLEITEWERCYGISASQRLAPLARTPGAPQAGLVRGRSFSPAAPAEILDGIQNGVLRSHYRGRRFYKSPFDIALYLRLLSGLRPKTIIEVGTADGGSALWFADTMTALGLRGNVISVDRQPPSWPEDDVRIRFLQADAARLDLVLLPDELARLPHPWLVVEDSAHTFETCLEVLHFFDNFLQTGDYIVTEGGVLRGLSGDHYLSYHDGPSRAVEAFIEKRGHDYEIDAELCDFYGFNITWNPNGWLRRK